MFKLLSQLGYLHLRDELSLTESAFINDYKVQS